MADENVNEQAESTETAPAATAEAAPAAEKPVEQAPAPKPSRTATPLPEGVLFIWGTGRRKKAVARVRIRPGTGTIQINKRPLEQFFHVEKDRLDVLGPLQAVNMLSAWDVWATVNGGGTTGQSGAVKLGLSRALIKAMPDLDADLRGLGLLTRDSRARERKKPGQPGARKRFQFSKR
jgi:small subunit ribosomal protein S9